MCEKSAALSITASAICADAQDVNSDHWALTDGLGRAVRDHTATGPRRAGKTVAMFYWTWHQPYHANNGPKNITEILRAHPEALKDYNHPAWGDNRPGVFFWEQPLLGYYRTTDPWVLRKHAEMLADAKVDAVFFDCSNASHTWKESYEALMATWDQAQKDGVNVPKIAFLLPFWPLPNSLVSLRQLYRDVYKPNRYPNLWFVWKGKPCIMAYPDNLTDEPEDREIAAFFTFRPGQPDYVNGPDPNRNDQWGWLENYPQHGYIRQDNGAFEQATVGIAQNTSPERNGHAGAFNVPDSQGRSFSKRNGFDPRPDAHLHGWNVLEQWDRAIELDPELVFITGWNEYIAGQWLPKHGWNGDPFSFVDQFDWDRSRDIEPNKGWGPLGDVYYCQLVDNIRRFKGMDAPQKISPPKTIPLGAADAWADVAPRFTHYRGNTFHRNHPGYGGLFLTDTSGRNDLVSAKVARDDAFLYFLVETAEALTPPTDRHWMMLLLDVDRDTATGWHGYDFIVNRVNPKNGKAILEKNAQNKWQWDEVAECDFAVTGNRLEIAIPKSALGITGDAINIEFKWNDNMQDEGNIMDFYVSGDTIPPGRFNFVYATQKENIPHE